MNKPGLYLLIKADVNDGDYITEIHEIDNEFSEKYNVLELVPILEKLAKIKGYDEDIEELFTEEEWGMIEGLLPMEPYEETIHTIEQVSIFTISNIKNYGVI